ncbi:transcriptional regulator [Staphylococcus condimenti]|uniref:transcriptional activator RinB n=1 Tax=Staphylococcus condimenti TaxID=70255 RepID=UPI00254DDDF0|nr:transcriptional regulator [Staphylococcus condimenti]MDK8646363.1 transcriptional regulator [Staphylococcus condimenti]
MKNFTHKLIRNLLIIAAWELGKYLGEQLVIYTNRNDEVDVPTDFNIDDHKHLNNLKAEVSD